MKLPKLFAILAACLLATVTAFAAGEVKIEKIDGNNVFIATGSNSTKEYTAASVGTVIKAGMTIKTGKGATTTIVFPNGVVVVIPENSEIVISQFLYNGEKDVPARGKEPAGTSSQLTIQVVRGSVAVDGNIGKNSSLTVVTAAGKISAGNGATMVTVAGNMATVQSGKGDATVSVEGTNVKGQVKEGQSVTIEKGSETLTTGTANVTTINNLVNPMETPSDPVETPSGESSIEGQNDAHSSNSPASV